MPNMKAVLFVPNNHQHVLSEMHLSAFEGLVRTKNNAQQPAGVYYFIPNFVTENGDIFPWIAMPEDQFRRTFIFDEDKIQTQFVRITRK